MQSVAQTVFQCYNLDAMLHDLLEKVKESFDRNGVEMPYNHVVIQMEK